MQSNLTLCMYLKLYLHCQSTPARTFSSHACFAFAAIPPSPAADLLHLPAHLSQPPLQPCSIYSDPLAFIVHCQIVYGACAFTLKPSALTAWPSAWTFALLPLSWTPFWISPCPPAFNFSLFFHYLRAKLEHWLILLIPEFCISVSTCFLSTHRAVHNQPNHKGTDETRSRVNAELSIQSCRCSKCA